MRSLVWFLFLGFDPGFTCEYIKGEKKELVESETYVSNLGAYFSFFSKNSKASQPELACCFLLPVAFIQLADTVQKMSLVKNLRDPKLLSRTIYAPSTISKRNSFIFRAVDIVTLLRTQRLRTRQKFFI